MRKSKPSYPSLCRLLDISWTVSYYCLSIGFIFNNYLYLSPTRGQGTEHLLPKYYTPVWFPVRSNQMLRKFVFQASSLYFKNIAKPPLCEEEKWLLDLKTKRFRRCLLAKKIWQIKMQFRYSSIVAYKVSLKTQQFSSVPTAKQNWEWLYDSTGHGEKLYRHLMV